MIKKFGGLPVNSRVFVDYTTGDIRFGYPRRRDAKRAKQNAFITALTLLIIPAGIIGYISWMGADIVAMVEYSNVNNISYWNVYKTNLTSIGWHKEYSRFMFPVVTVVILFMGVWFFTSGERLKTLYPKLNAFMLPYFGHVRHYTMVRNTINRKVELPLFKNVLLDYEASGEFADNLERLEIVEHPFKIVNKRGNKVNGEWLWKATFYFKKDCSRGALKLKFI